MGIIEKKTETTIRGYVGYRIWGMWGPYCNIPEAIFYLLKGDYRVWACLGSTGLLLRNVNEVTLCRKP